MIEMRSLSNVGLFCFLGITIVSGEVKQFFVSISFVDLVLGSKLQNIIAEHPQVFFSSA